MKYPSEEHFSTSIQTRNYQHSLDCIQAHTDFLFLSISVPLSLFIFLSHSHFISMFLFWLFQVARDRVVKNWQFVEGIGIEGNEFGSGYPSGTTCVIDNKDMNFILTAIKKL